MSGPLGPQEKYGIYIVNVIGGSIREIRADAFGGSISPDGAQVLFVALGQGIPPTQGIWEMTADGEGAHQVVAPSRGTRYGAPTWSRDGKRFAYAVLQGQGGNSQIKLVSRSAAGGDPVTVLDNPNLRGFLNLPGNRILYMLSQTTPDPSDENENLWEVRVNPATGAAVGQPRQLTNWSGFLIGNPAISANGKVFAFLKVHLERDVMVGNLAEDGNELTTPTRLTLSDRFDNLGGWTRDSKSILFDSDRSGRFDLYRQELGERTAQAISATPEEQVMPQLSPDGKRIVYLSTANLSAPTDEHIMRMPAGGGAPTPVFAVKGPTVQSFRCPSRPGALCVLAERDQAKNEIVFTTFDPVQGKKNVVATVPLPVGAWALSPDGSRIAATIPSLQRAVIHVVPIGGGKPTDIDVKGWIRLTSIGWAADGKSLFACSYSPRGTTLLHIDMNGDAHALLRNGQFFAVPEPSPDGRHLAFGAVVRNANAWVIANLPKP